MSKQQLWFVMSEYNDEDEPFHVYRTLEEVRKAYWKKRLTIDRGMSYSYTFKSGGEGRRGRRQFFVYSLDQVSLKDLQYYGYVDSREREAHYWSLVYNWDSAGLFDKYSNEPNVDRSLVHMTKDRDTVQVPGYYSIATGDYWGRMLDRFNEVFAPIKPESKETIRLPE